MKIKVTLEIVYETDPKFYPKKIRNDLLKIANLDLENGGISECISESDETKIISAKEVK